LLLHRVGNELLPRMCYIFEFDYQSVLKITQDSSRKRQQKFLQHIKNTLQKMRQNNNIRQYLDEASNNAHQKFLNADGFFDDDLSFTAGEDFMNTDGNAVSNGPAPTSQPYIIIVTNTGSAVSNFDFLGSNQYLFDTATSAWTTAGNLVVSNITISSGIPNITYREALQQFQQSPFSVGLTYIQSSSASQLLQAISVNTRDANGNLAQKPLIPTIDPYQQQTTVLAMKFGYRIDGFTKLIINSVLASTTVTFNIYPSDNINIARGLTGKQVSREFASPGIVKSQTVRLVQ